jgi:hypothetical protein
MKNRSLWVKISWCLMALAGGATAAEISVESPGACTRKTGFVITELMVKPATTNALEFVEIYNSNPFEEEIGEYTLEGEIDFTFPAGTMLAGQSYLVVAKDATALQAAYDLSGIQVFEYGEADGSNSLGSSGSLRLVNSCNGTILEIDYDNDAPWPVAANGAGHSLALVRPSYGENDPQAWAASDRVGGSPGTGETYGEEALRQVMINEILAHTDDPQLDTIELYNHSNTSVDLSGCTLSDDATTNKFTIPDGTVISARGFVIFDQAEMGFSLNAGGETLYFRNAAGTRMIDAVSFDGQENGITIGRYPDGGAEFHRMESLTLGSANSDRRIDEVVINEIMCDPISGDNDDEFVELYNQGSGMVDLSGWRLKGGIDFTFPDGATIAAGGYVVVARDALLQTNYAQLNAANTYGDYSGKLANSGDRVKLDKPDTVIDYDDPANPETNLIHIVVDDVTYEVGGQWPVWANGGGSSLERVDPRANPRRPTTWADSDETGKADWTDISVTGLLEQGARGASRIEGGLQGAGECLLDNVQVVSDGDTYVNNSTFNSGLTDWVMLGSFERSSLDANGYGGTSCLHLRSTTRCDTGANQVSGALSSSLGNGDTATISAKAKWQKGYPWLYLRLHGNYLEAPVRLAIPANLGTPGAVNSQTVANAAPSIDAVTHSPAVPAANEAVVVTACIEDPDGLSSASVEYRIDPATAYTSVAMNDAGTSGDAVAGDGIYSATIPGQSADTMVAFQVIASDAAGSSARIFPDNTPDNATRIRECLVRFGDATRASNFGTYRMWFTSAATTDWETRLVLSNEPIEGTFVYNDSRVIYNFGAHYAGSPYHQNWDAITNDCHYSFDMPLDDKLLGTDNFNKLHAPGNNPFQDETMTREQAGFWTARKLKLPWLYRRYVNVFVNGVARKTGFLMEDTQVPGSDFIEQYWPDDADGNLHKANFWWEYSDLATATGTELSKQKNAGTELLPYYNSEGQLHAPHYRWNWGPRAYGDTGGNDFTSVLDLITAANSGDTIAEEMLKEADMEEWMRVWAIRHAVGDLDHFGCHIQQNMYMYKPAEGRWALLIWDMNHLLGNNLSFGPGRGLFPDYSDYGSDTTLTAVYENPTFRRMYLRALKEIGGGPFQSAEMTQWLDVRYDAFVTDGLTPMSPDTSFSYEESRSSAYDGGGTAYFDGSIKDWIAEASTGILARVAEEDTAGFALTSPASVTSSTNLVTLTGTAPVELASITVNGTEYPVTWTSVTEWSIDVVADDATNTFDLQGLDVYGAPIAGFSTSVSVMLTGTADAPEDSIVINEILYNPIVSGDAFVELYNRSTTTAFDLTGWRMNGLGYTFPVMVLNPGAYLTIDDFDGTLDLDGETLTLYRPAGTTDAEMLVDQVRYDVTDPWPAASAGTSLQLMDADQDNRRAALWAVATGSASPPAGETLIEWSETWNYLEGVNLDGTDWTAAEYNDSAWSSGPGAFGEESSVLPHSINTVLLSPKLGGDLTCYFRKTIDFTGLAGASLKLTHMIDDGMVVYLDGEEVYRVGMSTGTPTYTTTSSDTVGDAAEVGPILLDVALQPGTHVLAVELHQVNTGSSDVVFDMMVATDYSAFSSEVSTPGAANNVTYANADIPALWLNEVMPSPSSGAAWVELYNAGDTALSLDGYTLSDDYDDRAKWAIADGTSILPGALMQIDLAVTSLTNGTIALSRDVDGTPELIDYLNYGTVSVDWSYGNYPDGDPCSRVAMYLATPGTANTNASAPLNASINEWMVDNDSTLADPIDGDYEDWFEIYNPGDDSIDLGGYFLTDDLTELDQFEIPSDGKYTIPAKGFLLVWADKEEEQNASDASALHVNFALSKDGETIALVASDGSVIDSVTFGAQSTDQSEGRVPDGGTTISAMESTPGAANEVSNTAPVLSAIADRQLFPGETVSFTVEVTDAESAYQALTFSLDSGAPAGATLTAGGTFSWTVPADLAASDWVTTIRVTDDGTPALDDSATFTLSVNALPQVDSSPSLTGDGLTLSVETTVGRDYNLTYKDALTNAIWIPLGETVSGNGANQEWEVPTTNAPMRFYRLSVE